MIAPAHASRTAVYGTRTHGGVTGKARKGLPMSITPAHAVTDASGAGRAGGCPPHDGVGSIRGAGFLGRLRRRALGVRWCELHARGR